VGDQDVGLVDLGHLRRDVVDERQDDQRQQHSGRGRRSGDRQQEPVAAHHRNDGTAHQHHEPQDLADQDHRGDQPRRERLDPLDQVGDEPHDGLVEERTDEHDDQQRADGDDEPQDVGRRPGRPARL
jgi:hypothetical protein